MKPIILHTHTADIQPIGQMSGKDLTKYARSIEIQMGNRKIVYFNNNNMEKARAIKNAFLESGLTVEEFAKKCKISKTALREYIALKTEPRDSTLQKVEDALEDDLYTLLIK